MWVDPASLTPRVSPSFISLFSSLCLPASHRLFLSIFFSSTPTQAIACKPLFFDLAGNHVAYPSLKHRLGPKKEAQKAKPAKKPAAERTQAAAKEPATAAAPAAGQAQEEASGGVTGMFKSIAGGWWGSK